VASGGPVPHDEIDSGNPPDLSQARRDDSGHVFCSFLALLLKRALEQRLEEKGESWEWAEILRGLDNLQEVEARFQGKRFVLRSQVLGQAHKAFMAAGVALPPTLREKA